MVLRFLPLALEGKVRGDNEWIFWYKEGHVFATIGILGNFVSEDTG